MGCRLTALTLVLTLASPSLAGMVQAFPGNTQAFDCYRKADNSFSFGSPTDVTNNAILCVPNPDLAPATPTPEVSSGSSNAGNVAAGIAIGLGAAALGRAIFDDNDNEVTVYPPGYRPGRPYNGYNYYRRGNNYYYHNRSGQVRQGITR